MNLTLIALLVGAVVMAALLWWAVRLGQDKGKSNAQKKQLDAFEAEMDRVGRANQARLDAERRARAGELSDDPNNRDTWGL